MLFTVKAGPIVTRQDPTFLTRDRKISSELPELSKTPLTLLILRPSGSGNATRDGGRFELSFQFRHTAPVSEVHGFPANVLSNDSYAVPSPEVAITLECILTNHWSSSSSYYPSSHWAVDRNNPLSSSPGHCRIEDSHNLMIETLADIAKQASVQSIYIGDGMARKRRTEIEQMTSETPRMERWLKTYQLAKAELNLGNELVAIQRMNEALDLIRDNPNQIKPEFLQHFYFDAAVTYLRWGETQNCCQRNSPESCIVPIQGEAIHTKQDGSRKGIEWLTALLRSTETDQPMHLGARWLLNLAYMTLGEYPKGVPPEYLIKGIDAASDVDTKAWKNIAADAGVATFSLAGGAIADDFDGDGDIDIVVSSSDPRESLQIFWNDGQGRFSNGTRDANLDGIIGGLNITQTDFNNDGNIDIFVMRGGWLSIAGRHPNSLLRNNGDGTFTDITITAGLALPQLPTQTADWADYDLDGDLGRLHRQ